MVQPGVYEQRLEACIYTLYRQYQKKIQIKKPPLVRRIDFVDTWLYRLVYTQTHRHTHAPSTMAECLFPDPSVLRCSENYNDIEDDQSLSLLSADEFVASLLITEPEQAFEGSVPSSSSSSSSCSSLSSLQLPLPLPLKTSDEALMRMLSMMEKYRIASIHTPPEQLYFVVHTVQLGQLPEVLSVSSYAIHASQLSLAALQEFLEHGTVKTPAPRELVTTLLSNATQLPSNCAEPHMVVLDFVHVYFSDK